MSDLFHFPKMHKKCTVVHSWFYDSVYNVNFYVAYGTAEDLEKYLALEFDYQIGDLDFVGRTIFIKDPFRVIVLFNSDKILHVSAYKYADILAHEGFHAVDFVFERLGVELEPKGNNEHWSYYLGFVVLRTTEFLMDSIKIYKKAKLEESR